MELALRHPVVAWVGLALACVGLLIWLLVLGRKQTTWPGWMLLLVAFGLGGWAGAALVNDPQGLLVAGGGRFFHGFNVWVALGLIVALRIPGLARAVVASFSGEGLDKRFEVVRHWGGLGSGEGGWKLELGRDTAATLLRVAGLVAVCLVALALVMTGAPTPPKAEADSATSPAKKSKHPAASATTTPPKKEADAQGTGGAAGSPAEVQ
jgi:hypothetical protein